MLVFLSLCGVRLCFSCDKPGQAAGQMTCPEIYHCRDVFLEKLPSYESFVFVNIDIYFLFTALLVKEMILHIYVFIRGRYVAASF